MKIALRLALNAKGVCSLVNLGRFKKYGFIPQILQAA